MKQMYFIVTAIALMLVTTGATAQRVRVTDGSLDALRGVRKVNIQYDYSHMDVGNKPEQDYIADKKESYNRKEPGKGNKWEKDWVADRTARFEPRLEEEFNKNGDLQAGYFPKEKYTIIFKTVYTEPGYNIGISRKNAYIDGEAWLVETANPSNVLAKIEVSNCPGRTFMGNDYDTGLRIQEAYAMAGKGLARYLAKHIE